MLIIFRLLRKFYFINFSFHFMIFFFWVYRKAPFPKKLVGMWLALTLKKIWKEKYFPLLSRESCVLAHQFGLNSFLGTQLSVIQNMSTVGQKNILSMHSPLFINSFPELPLQPPSSHLPLHVTTGSYAFSLPCQQPSSSPCHHGKLCF